MATRGSGAGATLSPRRTWPVGSASRGSRSVQPGRSSSVPGSSTTPAATSRPRLSRSISRHRSPGAERRFGDGPERVTRPHLPARAVMPGELRSTRCRSLGGDGDGGRSLGGDGGRGRCGDHGAKRRERTERGEKRRRGSDERGGQHRGSRRGRGRLPSWRWRATAMISIATLSTSCDHATQITTATAFTITSDGTPSRVSASPIVCGEGSVPGQRPAGRLREEDRHPDDQDEQREQGDEALQTAARARLTSPAPIVPWPSPTPSDWRRRPGGAAPSTGSWSP